MAGVRRPPLGRPLLLPDRVRTLHRLFPGIMANMRSGDENRIMGSLIAMRLLAKRFE